LNNVLEQDHLFVKRCVNSALGFGVLATAQYTVQGYGAIHLLCKGRIEGMTKGDVLAQTQVINQLFGLTA
jgi:transposase-like protein